MLKKPLISIITPVHNMSNFLEETIRSVFAQTYTNWEWYIIDDASTDNTTELIKKYQKKDKRIKPIFAKKRSGGAGPARNLGVKNALGKFIAFLDGDDLWYPEKLERQIQFMLANNYLFTYTAYEQIAQDSKPTGRIFRFKKKKVDFHDIARSCSMGCSTVILRFPEQKIYIENIPQKLFLCQDLIYWLSILKEIPNAYYLDEVLMKHRLHDSALSRNKFKQLKAQWRVYREFLNLDLLHSCWNFFFYATLGFLKNYWPYRKNIPW